MSSKKKSLGHNPLAYSMRGHASFDFISPYTDEEEEGSVEKQAPETTTEQPEEIKEKKVEKVVTSYYLEKPLVELIKDIADSQDMSYSAVTNEILKNSLFGS